VLNETLRSTPVLTLDPVRHGNKQSANPVKNCLSIFAHVICRDTPPSQTQHVPNLLYKMSKIKKLWLTWSRSRAVVLRRIVLFRSCRSKAKKAKHSQSGGRRPQFVIVLFSPVPMGRSGYGGEDDGRNRSLGLDCFGNVRFLFCAKIIPRDIVVSL